jgi:hypothetical protein
MIISTSHQTVSDQTIDATGCDVGIYVSPGTTDVTIEGVSVTGANQHGIFVQDASHITIQNDVVSGNGVATAVCPASGAAPPLCIPENKPIELVGTSNSIVRWNIVTDNSADGGIGISDDGPQNPGAPTGVAGSSLQAVNDNVTANQITDNTQGCGIVVAAYNPGVGVERINVQANSINGQAPGTPITSSSGPLIGQIVIATDAPETWVKNVNVIGNTIDGSFLPGIVLHANVFGDQILNTVIRDNTLSDTGYYPGPPPGAPGHNPDVPGATDGTTGISLVAEYPPFSGDPGSTYPIISNTLVDSNTVLGDKIGVWMCNNNDTVITNLLGDPAVPAASCVPPSASGGGPSTTSQLTVTTQGTGGSMISGLFVSLWQNGNQVSSCFSPCAFTVNNGQSYQIAADNFGPYTLTQWSDGSGNVLSWGGTHDVSVPAMGGPITLNAIYSS